MSGDNFYCYVEIDKSDGLNHSSSLHLQCTLRLYNYVANFSGLEFIQDVLTQSGKVMCGVDHGHHVGLG